MIAYEAVSFPQVNIELSGLFLVQEPPIIHLPKVSVGFIVTVSLQRMYPRPPDRR